MTETENWEGAGAIASDTAARGASQWLRMLAQAGLIAVPRLAETTAAQPGSAVPARSGAELPRDDLRAAWETIVTSPAPPTPPSATRADSPASSMAASAANRQASVATTTPARPTPMPSAPQPSVSQQPVPQQPVSTESPAVKRPGSGGPSYVQSAANPSGAGTPAMRGVTGSGVEDGPPLTQVPDLGDADRVVALQQLAQEVSHCTRCPDLVRNRTQTVFGFGAPRTRLVLMGEAPGADEDRLGEPMVGASGQLLDKIIAAMKLRREEVYILNAVKCQPPKNRNPLDVECGNCRSFWVRQLEIIRPEVIVCLGAVASKTLLQTTDPVGRLRGTVHVYRGAKVIVTYHPSYLLRTESKKRETWDDMKVVMDLLGIPR